VSLQCNPLRDESFDLFLLMLLQSIQVEDPLAIGLIDRHLPACQTPDVEER
jgi:hypothetical protein